MGLPEFTKTAVIASVTSKSLHFTQGQGAGAVGAGATETVDVFGPAGSINRSADLDLVVPAPAGATSGTHSLQVLSTQGGVFDALYAVYPFGGTVQFRYRFWNGTPSTQYPGDATAQALSSQGVMFNDQVGVRFVYTNNTDVAQNGGRTYNILAEREVVS